MGTSDADLYAPAKPRAVGPERRLAPWHKMSPLLWAPFMYTSRLVILLRKYDVEFY